MKKLKLGKLKVSQDEILQKDQLSKIFGGNGDFSSGSCWLYCSDGNTYNTVNCGTAEIDRYCPGPYYYALSCEGQIGWCTFP